jgi:hypothetical protein
MSLPSNYTLKVKYPSNKYGGNYCSVICADTAEATGGLNVSKKIRITKGYGWYEDKVGELYNVIRASNTEEFSKVFFVEHPNNSDTVEHYVSLCDCEIVGEESDEPNTQAQRIEAVCNEVRDLLIRKNHDYGDSFSKQFAKYGVLSGMIRMDDKMRRLETLIDGEEAQVAESIEDTVADLAGYALLTLVELRKDDTPAK